MPWNITAGILSPLYSDFPTSMLIGIAGASPLLAFGRSVGILSFCAAAVRLQHASRQRKNKRVSCGIAGKIDPVVAKLQTSLHFRPTARNNNSKCAFFFLLSLASPFLPFGSLFETKENGTDSRNCRCRFGVVRCPLSGWGGAQAQRRSRI